ncbi:hypothetical protein [Methylobacter tundripaludum]|uniref:hypothetical protein n=1 Tax=Methylobacter tundripaludum TaxID=173365 RepID=UPI0011B09EFC|nr:hypothetical protein [Methylobacter tundripaludum]
MHYPLKSFDYPSKQHQCPAAGAILDSKRFLSGEKAGGGGTATAWADIRSCNIGIRYILVDYAGAVAET